MAITIKDIAREANVSVSSVSFAINGTGPVAPETKRRIFEIIERFNYQPNTAARGMKTRKTNNICLHIPHPESDIFTFSGNSLFNDLLQGIGSAIDEKGYNLLLAWDHKDVHMKPSKLLSLARSRAVDGILFSQPNHDFETLNELLNLKFPFVFMGRVLGDRPMDVVDIDNFDASYRNTSHLIKLGHKKIAFISPGPLDYLLAEDRLEGYKEALDEANIRRNDQYVYIGDTREQSGYAAMEFFLSLKEPPTAIVTGRDIQALGILQYARTHNLSIPDDIAFVSFENSDIAHKHDISSMTTDLYQIGKESSKLLLQTIGRKKERQPQNIVIPAELVVRKTCGGQRE
ncbi:MAG TPA: LacI family DNA-binding transcriptional regulator [Bacilli bacterium]